MTSDNETGNRDAGGKDSGHDILVRLGTNVQSDMDEYEYEDEGNVAAPGLFTSIASSY